ncbi:MAG: hypothetical protein JXN64_09265 [Spirochaetes bacterium]|nr:hypothetical protein [Spirochaetota bacterium]
MSIALQYNPERKILHATILDQMSSGEFTDVLKNIIDSDDYPPDVGILWDMSSINKPIGNRKFDLDLAEIQNIFSESGKVKIAIITPSDFTFGKGRMYDMVSIKMPQNINVFKNFIEAEEWLARTGN